MIKISLKISKSFSKKEHEKALEYLGKNDGTKDKRL
jgi:hypothetical protein